MRPKVDEWYAGSERGRPQRADRFDWGESWEMPLTFEEDRVHFAFASMPGTGSFRFETTGHLD
jgi:hypothetical protein